MSECTRARDARKEARNAPLLSRAFSHPRGHLRVSRVLLDRLRKTRDYLYSRMITLLGALDWQSGDLWREEREGISTKKGKETHTLLSLRSWQFSGRCCTFLAAEPREDWEQVKDGFSTFSLAVSPLASSGSYSPRKYPRHNNPASYAGYNLLHVTTWILRARESNEPMRCNWEHHRTLRRSSVFQFAQRPQLGLKQWRSLYTHGRNRALLCFWIKSERKINAGTRH